MGRKSHTWAPLRGGCRQWGNSTWYCVIGMPQKDTLDRAAYTCMLVSYRRLSAQFQFSLSADTLGYLSQWAGLFDIRPPFYFIITPHPLNPVTLSPPPLCFLHWNSFVPANDDSVLFLIFRRRSTFFIFGVQCCHLVATSRRIWSAGMTGKVVHRRKIRPIIIRRFDQRDWTMPVSKYETISEAIEVSL